MYTLAKKIKRDCIYIYIYIYTRAIFFYGYAKTCVVSYSSNLKRLLLITITTSGFLLRLFARDHILMHILV